MGFKGIRPLYLNCNSYEYQIPCPLNFHWQSRPKSNKRKLFSTLKISLIKKKKNFLDEEGFIFLFEPTSHVFLDTTTQSLAIAQDDVFYTKGERERWTFLQKLMMHGNDMAKKVSKQRATIAAWAGHAHLESKASKPKPLLQVNKWAKPMHHAARVGH